MKEYTIHTMERFNKSSMYKTSDISFYEKSWLKIIDAKLWLDGDWSEKTYTRLYPINRIYFIDEEYKE